MRRKTAPDNVTSSPNDSQAGRNSAVVVTYQVSVSGWCVPSFRPIPSASS
eukprot:COSAG04_NODE_18516_length_439_cov_1.764706_1_plen_49_part_01